MDELGGAGRQIIRREGEYWTLVFGGDVCRLKHTNGMRYLAYLLQRPHQRILAADIVRRESAADGADTCVSDDVTSERARINVTRALHAILKRLEAHHPELVHHLRTTLRTGRFCVYSPDPRVAIVWSDGRGESN